MMIGFQVKLSFFYFLFAFFISIFPTQETIAQTEVKYQVQVKYNVKVKKGSIVCIKWKQFFNFTQSMRYDDRFCTELREDLPLRFAQTFPHPISRNEYVIDGVTSGDNIRVFTWKSWIIGSSGADVKWNEGSWNGK